MDPAGGRFGAQQGDNRDNEFRIKKKKNTKN